MSNLLSTAKKVLFDHAVELYTIIGEDLSLEKQEFKTHYSNLGEILFEIETLESFTDLTYKLESGFFSQLGYDPEDEDLLGEFLKAVVENS